MMMGPKNGYSQLFYLSKQRIREILDYKDPVNATYMQNLEQIVAKLESMQNDLDQYVNDHSDSDQQDAQVQQQAMQEALEYKKIKDIASSLRGSQDKKADKSEKNEGL